MLWIMATNSSANCSLIWEDEEVFLLVDTWADENIQQKFDSCLRKKPIFEKIAKRLAEKEYVRTYSQVRGKIKQRKQEYRKVKDNNNLSGRVFRAGKQTMSMSKKTYTQIVQTPFSQYSKKRLCWQGIEPWSPTWKARILPPNHQRQVRPAAISY